jgi:hypothetical protein
MTLDRKQSTVCITKLYTINLIKRDGVLRMPYPESPVVILFIDGITRVLENDSCRKNEQHCMTASQGNVKDD